MREAMGQGGVRIPIGCMGQRAEVSSGRPPPGGGKQAFRRSEPVCSYSFATKRRAKRGRGVGGREGREE